MREFKMFQDICENPNHNVRNYCFFKEYPNLGFGKCFIDITDDDISEYIDTYIYTFLNFNHRMV